jgi:hypothetical protein
VKLSNDAIERVVGDFDGSDLGDPRRQRRLTRIVSQLAAQPWASIPDAMGSVAALEGAYRFMNNRAVSFEALHGSHVKAAVERCRAAKAVLVVHDTTTCEFAHAEASEVGYLPTGAAGFQLHIALAIDATQWRRPLGVLSAEVLSRAKRSGRGSRKRKVSGAETSKWKDRESARWWRGVENATAALEGVSHIHVADREGDSYELLGAMRMANLRFVVRNKHDRRARDPENADLKWSTMRELAKQAEGSVERDVPLAARKRSSTPRENSTHPPRKARLAHLRFSATTVEVRRPRYLDDPLPETLRLNLVHVVETNAPTGQRPVEWNLITTEPVDTPKQVTEIVDIYRTRWTIEEFNKALKTGCLYEQREFESRSALLVVLALSLPIACELLWLRSRARTEPNAPATDVVSPTQIDVLRTMGARKLSPAPTVREILLAIAELGGHQRSNGEPGWLILNRGLRKVQDWEGGWRAALAQMREAPPERSDLS